MAKYYGWSGATLDVNLTTKKIEKKFFSKEILRKYIGGRGLTVRILYDEVGPDTDPLSPDNIVMITQGPLCGTGAPSGGRYDVISKSPYTGIFAGSNGGGFFGPELKWAGYDLVLIRGQSEKPVYLWIDDDRVEIRDASHLWGKDTWVTQGMIRDEIGDPEVKTLKIGPAGENLCFSSCLIGDLNRAAGKMSLGAIWGAKRLKAMAVRGTRGVNIARPQQFAKKCLELFERVKGDPLYNSASKYGTLDWVWQHYRDWTLPGVAPNLTTESISAFYDKSLACFGCDVHCSNWFSVKEGNYKGTFGEGIEGNTAIYCALAGINDPAFVLHYHTLCGKLGIHLDFPGVAYKWASAIYEEGLITKEDTGGIEILLGNEEGFLKLIHMMAYKEGFGEIMDAYPLRAVEVLGKGHEQMAHTKGVYGFGPGMEGWIAWAFGLSIADRGRDHLTGAPFAAVPGLHPEYSHELLEKLGRRRYNDSTVFTDMWSPSPVKSRYVFDNENIYIICDSVGVCKFRSEMCHYVEGIHLEDFAELLSEATGVDFTLEDLQAAAERIFCLKRAFNAREGIRRIDDYPWALRWELEHDGQKHPRFKPEQLKITMEGWDLMLDEYYRLRGCDLETGIPAREKLVELGLEDVAGDLEDREILPLNS